MIEDEVVRQHHQLNGYEFGKAPGDGEGQEGKPMGGKESYTADN